MACKKVPFDTEPLMNSNQHAYTVIYFLFFLYNDLLRKIEQFISKIISRKTEKKKDFMFRTFKFHLLLPSSSRGEEEKALPSISQAYSTDWVFPEHISFQNSSSIYFSGRLHVLEYLRMNSLFAIFSKSLNVYFLLIQL